MSSSSCQYLFNIIFSVLFGLFLFSSLGCATTPAPVITVKPLVSVMSGYHLVQQGETLYSIAWRYDRDFREIAKINQISSPYHLKVGQRLRLDPELKLTKLVKKAKDQKMDVGAGHCAGPVRLAKWHWPTTGKIIKCFSFSNSNLNSNFIKDVNKGIDIEGQLGAPVRAAMNGKVVYSGSGLRGLGQLLIIKHDDNFLSAYAYNQELMVKEGQHVKQGQTIAKMGNAGADNAKLHFEIRHQGRPVNPLHYLPSRSQLVLN